MSASQPEAEYTEKKKKPPARRLGEASSQKLLNLFEVLLGEGGVYARYVKLFLMRFSARKTH